MKATTTETKLLNVIDLARRWQIHPNTLRNWIVQGKGPKVTRIGKTRKNPGEIRYRLEDVEAYERSNNERP